MKDAWLVWGCCASCVEEDSLDEALSYAYAVDRGDGHVLHGVECPDGTLIGADSATFRDYARQRDVDLKARREAAEKRGRVQLAVVCVRSPFNKRAWTRERYFDQVELDADLPKFIARYGEERVRVLTGAEMDDRRKP